MNSEQKQLELASYVLCYACLLIIISLFGSWDMRHEHGMRFALIEKINKRDTHDLFYYFFFHI
jgi:hypothetical protein